MEHSFIVLTEAIISTGDISTVRPYREDGLRVKPGDASDGVRVTMRSKATHVDLPGITLEGFASLLSGAAY